MRLFARTLMLYQFGLYISLGLFTMITMNLIVSGDSTTPKKRPTTLQSIQPKVGDVVRNSTRHLTLQCR